MLKVTLETAGKKPTRLRSGDVVAFFNKCDMQVFRPSCKKSGGKNALYFRESWNRSPMFYPALFPRWDEDGQDDGVKHIMQLISACSGLGFMTIPKPIIYGNARRAFELRKIIKEKESQE